MIFIVSVILISILICLNYYYFNFSLYHAYQLTRYKFDYIYFLFIWFWSLIHKLYLRKGILYITVSGHASNVFFRKWSPIHEFYILVRRKKKHPLLTEINKYKKYYTTLTCTHWPTYQNADVSHSRYTFTKSCSSLFPPSLPHALPPCMPLFFLSLSLAISSSLTPLSLPLLPIISKTKPKT